MTEPKEPDVVPLDDPTVPYSLVPVGEGSDAPRPPYTDLLRRLDDVIAMDFGIRGVPHGLPSVTVSELLRDVRVALRAGAVPTSRHQRDVKALAARCVKHALEIYEFGQPEGLAAEDVLAIAIQEFLDHGAVPASPWRPIETAPQGCMILVCSMQAVEARDWCFVDWVVQGKLCAHPKRVATHWMPLPSPPVLLPHADATSAK